ncbi:MAG: hypothetical protein RL685_2436 [Pseudomonadota bacterium]
MSALTPRMAPANAEQLTAKALRQLFLTLFLRGRSARGLRRSTAPRSIWVKLGWTLGLYVLVGFSALLADGSLFTLAATLHASTFLFVGMFLASSAGEVLFNHEEADILLHRPVPAGMLLWAKIRVLLEVSLWLAGALNLVGLFVGALMPGGGWLFPVAHVLSVALETLFCTSCVVLVYELCLRWFGRERLDALLTTTQVLVGVAAMMAGQVVPQLLRRFQAVSISADSWWLGLLPPVWFASFDDAFAGARGGSSWLLAAIGVAATAALAAIAFGKLASDYGHGLQLLNEAQAPAPGRAARRWFDRLVNSPPLCWWLRDPVTRAAFLLTAAYLVRDRDVKLRLYPGLAPMLAMPVVFLLQASGRDGDSFSVALSGSFLGLAPMTVLSILRFSQQWQATEIFRVAPLPGPAAIFRGARRAVLVVLTLPLILLLAGLALLLRVPGQDLLLLLPGMLAMPVYPLFVCLDAKGLPLSQPTDEAHAAGRGLRLVGVMLIAMLVSAIGAAARTAGWLWWLLLVEAIGVALMYVSLRSRLSAVSWSSVE